MTIHHTGKEDDALCKDPKSAECSKVLNDIRVGHIKRKFYDIGYQ